MKTAKIQRRVKPVFVQRRKIPTTEPTATNPEETLSTSLEAALQVLTNSPVLDYLGIWEPEPDRWYSASELFSLWQEACKVNRVHYYFKNIGHLGKHLVNIRGALKTQYGLKWSRAAGKKYVYCWPGKQ